MYKFNKNFVTDYKIMLEIARNLKFWTKLWIGWQCNNCSFCLYVFKRLLKCDNLMIKMLFNYTRKNYKAKNNYFNSNVYTYRVLNRLYIPWQKTIKCLIQAQLTFSAISDNTLYKHFITLGFISSVKLGSTSTDNFKVAMR